MKILLTGATSLAGRRLFELLLRKGHHVTGVSRRPPQNQPFCTADLESPDAARQLPDESFDVLIHFASFVPANERIGSWQACSRANLHGTSRLLEWADRRVSRIIAASSCAVYGPTIHAPANEDHPLLPDTPYAISKYGQEQLLHAFCRARGLPLLILRLGSVYGPDISETRVVIRFIKDVLTRAPITLRNSRTTGMNLIHQDDVARITEALVQKGQGTFNLGSAEFISLDAYVEAVMTAAGQRTNVARLDEPGALVTGHFSSSLYESYGLKPEIPLSDGLAGLLKVVA